jgi:hypothetical protein
VVWAWLLLVAADGESEAAKLLRIAYASQYEWREDAVENVVLEFRYKAKRKWSQGAAEEFEGRAHAVVVGGEIVRRHYRGLSKDRRERLDGHLDWVVARFARKPFEEAFKDAKLEGPEPGTDGKQTVTSGNTAFHLKNGRIVGLEYREGEHAPWIAMQLVLADVRDAYAILGESQARTAVDAGTFEHARRLHLFSEQEPPAPLRYVYTAKAPGSEEEVAFDFSPPKFNNPDAVVVHAAARDALAAAWAGRYGLPETLRCTGAFARKADPKAWSFGPDRCEGQFRVLGLARVEVDVDAPRSDRQSTAGLDERIAADFRWLFGLLRAQPFETAFAGRGFDLTSEGKSAIVHVFGDPEVLAYRIADGRIVAHLENTADEDAWWEHKTRKVGDRYLVEKLSRRVGEKTFVQEIQYAKVRGLHLPRAFSRFHANAGFRGSRYAVDEYELRNVRVLD